MASHSIMNQNVRGLFASTSVPSSSSILSTDLEQVDYMGNGPRQQGNPYSNTYNPGWHNHPNFGWRNNNAQGPPDFQRPHQQPPQQQQRAGPSQLPPPAKEKSNLEELMMKFVTSTETRFQQTDSALRNQQASIGTWRDKPPRKKLESEVIEAKKMEDMQKSPNKLPLKKRDLGSFTVPRIISDLHISGALADLGANINLMPISLFDELGLSEPKPTRMSIQLADRTIKIARGIIEDVLIKVDKFIFPIDFVVMDMKGESTVPLILGRPFLATSRAVIDVCDRKLQLRGDDETITFDLATTMRHSLDHDDVVLSMDILDDVVESHLQEILLDDPLQVALQGDEEELSNE
ncbi:uncharacterized protein LOC125369280 [Ricinus communis]|uniref:uncharacterized protein LOC125369280 n=1 Tax=Ricinus communis TaxID=3988 RepID=UPI00201AB55A|nr:uncharacterized protein LOC125369280 [Ricinus communis]